MKRAKLKISTYVIDDALLADAAENTISIPCESDTKFCMQLDGWDENTSIPATLDNKPVLLYRQYYDKKKASLDCENSLVISELKKRPS